jgi:RHS repeat-associated protein
MHRDAPPPELVDQAGRLASIGAVRSGTTLTGLSTTTARFNRFGEVTEERLPGSRVITYTYDKIGNMASYRDAGGTVAYTHTPVNLLASLTEPDGKRTTSSTGATYDYNTSRQTTSMRRAGGTAISAGYVGADQRQRATAAGETFTNTLLGVSVRTVGTAGAQHYVRDDTGGLVGIGDTSNGTRGYYLFDGLGSVAAITSATTAAVLNRYTYDPYGATTEQRLTGAMNNQWRYTGEYQDAATGLYKIGHRYLDTTLGRWTQQDPLLRAANPMQPAEANPYAYVGCNPVNYTDPSGLATTEQWIFRVAWGVLVCAPLAAGTGGTAGVVCGLVGAGLDDLMA